MATSRSANGNIFSRGGVLARLGGFTLVEVLVALAIVGGLLVTLVVTTNRHLSIAGDLENRLRLQDAGERLLEDLLAEEGIAEGERSGRLEQEGFSYRIRIQPAEGLGVSGIGLLWVHLTVENPSGESCSLDLWTPR